MINNTNQSKHKNLPQKSNCWSTFLYPQVFEQFRLKNGLSRLPQSSCGKCPFSCALRPLRVKVSTNQKKNSREKFVDAAEVLSYLRLEGVVSIKIYDTHTHTLNLKTPHICVRLCVHLQNIVVALLLLLLSYVLTARYQKKKIAYFCLQEIFSEPVNLQGTNWTSLRYIAIF